MKRPAPPRLARLLLAASLAAGCGSAPPTEPLLPTASGAAASATSSPAADATPRPTPSERNTLPGLPTPAPSAGGGGPSDESLAVPASAAWGEVKATRLPAAVGKGQHFVVANAVTPDGRFVIGSVLRDGFGLTPGTEPGEAALYEVATGRVVEMARLQSVDSQVQSAAADGDHVVWQEAADQDGFDWRLYDYSIPTGRVREIARAATKGGKPVPSPLSTVWASHGVIVWGQAVGAGVAEGDVSNAVVRRADLSTGRVTTVATRAGSPALSWPWLAWESLPADGSWRTVLANLETGWTGSMAATPESMAMSGVSAAFAAADLHSIWVLDDVSRPDQARQVARGADETDYLEWPTLNDRVVAWAQNGQSIVYDRAEGRLVTLPVAAGWASGIAGRSSLVWVEADADGNAASIVVVDTSSLPVLP